jgi:phage terminase small subunit
MAPTTSTYKQPLWWQVFITEYLKNGQIASAAYAKAKPHVGKRTANVEGAKLLSNPAFKLALEEAQSKAAAVIGMSRDRWLKMLCDVAEFDIRDYLKLESGSGDVQLVDDWKQKANGHAISEVQFQTTTLESGAVVQRVKVSRESKLKALEILGKSLGYLKDHVEHSGAVGFVFSKELQEEIEKESMEISNRFPKLFGLGGAQ